MEIIINKNGITEAKAAALYFLGNTNFNTSGYAAVIDIGGGTTDLSFWNQRKLKWEDSVKFAGGDLLEILSDLLAYVEAINISDYDIMMRKWPYVDKSWDKKMESLTKKPFYNKAIRTICLFYCGICYYIGLHLRGNGINKTLDHVAFAGNGIRFLEIITIGNELSQGSLGNWIKLFRKMIAAGQGLEENGETSFVFSSEPKLEVAFGLVSKNLLSFHTEEETSKKLLGLNLSLDGVDYKYNEWAGNHTAADFNRADVDYEILIEFIKHFKDKAKEYFKNWDLDSLVEDFTKTMKDQVGNSFEKRDQEELATSLFLESLKAYMKWQYTK